MQPPGQAGRPALVPLGTEEGSERLMSDKETSVVDFFQGFIQ